jgi:hypothetical protein
MILSKELLSTLFEYKDGVLFRKVARSNRVKVGQKASNINNKGYLYTSINGKNFLEHRIIWAMHYDSVPKCIDHKDNNKLNNRIENLREATPQENQQNSAIPKNNTSGTKNVTFCKRTKKWQVQLMINYKLKFFGRYKFKEIACVISQLARHKNFGEFANHG